jgi:hypothetical protein
MEMSVESGAAADLPPGEIPSLNPMNRRVGGPKASVDFHEVREKYLAPLEFEPWIGQQQVQSVYLPTAAASPVCIPSQCSSHSSLYTFPLQQPVHSVYIPNATASPVCITSH